MRRFSFLLLPLLLGLGGCNLVVLDPSGHIASEQRDLLVISTLLMLIIIVPVMALTVFFAFRYRRANTSAKYDPDWDHSTILELVIWAAPLAIIICLGAITYLGTHLLDPYRSLSNISANEPVPVDVEPLEVEVVALDWKWLFLYPQYGVATVNEMAAPVDRPISFKLTSAAVMNAFYVPALAGMIYTMPGMETQLHAVMNKPGTFEGFSSNYSGAGFSGMRFAFQSLDGAGFDAWIEEAKASGETLDRTRYQTLAEPSERHPVERFGSVEDGLYTAIVEQCVTPGSICMSDYMALNEGSWFCGPQTTAALASADLTIRHPAWSGPVLGAGMSLPTDPTWQATDATPAIPSNF